jgi:hypothetical protein
MSNWFFTTPTTDEAPFAWNDLMIRFRITRGISVRQTAPGPNYQLVRYSAYTDESGAANYPPPPVGTFAQPTGLNFFRGGYVWVVNDATKADLINSGIGITNSNFTPAP